MFTNECSYTKCFYYIYIVNDLLYEKRKIKEMKVKKKKKKKKYFRRARADNSGVGGGIWPKFELIQAFMHVLVTCKNEVDGFKNEGARVYTRFLPL